MHRQLFHTLEAEIQEKSGIIEACHEHQRPSVTNASIENQTTYKKK